MDVEPSLLKLFRNLWFYIALFGLAPPIQKIHQPIKSVSTSLNSVGSMGTIALQAVGGPYMWNVHWSSAVQRIAQGTPPLVSFMPKLCVCVKKRLLFRQKENENYKGRGRLLLLQ